MPHPNVVAERSSAGYLRLLLSRPDQRNALVPGMVVALTDAMQADGDAVVLLGSTDPGGFWAGADLSLRIAGPGPGRRGAGPAGAGLAVGAWILPDLVGRGAALELCMTGRWVDAAEALTLGLVHRVEDDPDRAAAGLAETLAAAGPLGPGRIKTVASAGGLLDRLWTERQVNRAAFGQALDGEAW